MDQPNDRVMQAGSFLQIIELCPRMTNDCIDEKGTNYYSHNPSLSCDKPFSTGVCTKQYKYYACGITLTCIHTLFRLGVYCAHTSCKELCNTHTHTHQYVINPFLSDHLSHMLFNKIPKTSSPICHTFSTDKAWVATNGKHLVAGESLN